MTEIEQKVDMAGAQKNLAHVNRLLQKHKLVENFVRRQDMPRHDLVEIMVHKQNLAELQTLLDRLDALPIALILEVLSPEDREIIWGLVRDDRKEEILLAISDTIRVELVTDVKPRSRNMMIRVFDLYEGRLRQIPIETREDLAQSKPIWIDLVAPEEEQLEWAAKFLGWNYITPKN